MIRRIAPVLAAVLLAACHQATPTSNQVLSLMFKEAGTDEFVPMRVVVSPGFVRIDDGETSGDFTLYDRAARVVYSSSADNRTILVVPAAPVTIEPPIALSHGVEAFDVGENPSPVGGSVRGVRLRTNGETCWELVVADGVAEEARKALGELERALAGEHARVLAFTPEDLRTPCGMANDVFEAGRQYAQGFPVRSADMRGNQRLLTAVDTPAKIDPALFELPSSYRRITVNELRGGG